MNPIVATSIATLLALAGCIGGNNVGNAAPDFSLTDSTGRTLSLDSYEGKPLVMMFGSVNSCESCIVVAKNVIKPLLQETGGQVASLTISMFPGESDEDLEKFRKENGATWDFARDTDSVGQRYGITQLTTVVVLDSSHKIVLQKVEPSKAEIRAALGL